MLFFIFLSHGRNHCASSENLLSRDASIYLALGLLLDYCCAIDTGFEAYLDYANLNKIMKNYDMEGTNISLTDSEEEYTPYVQRPETYIVPTLFFLIFFIGVIGNGTLVIVFLRHQAMRNVPNTYIFSLALADLLVIITCVPFTSIVYAMEYWPWGVAVCKISECAKDISIGVSVFTLTALSAERYCAIVNPLKRLQTKRVTVFSAVMIWIVAIGCALPNAIFARIKHDAIGGNKTIPYCFPFPAIDNYQKYSVVAKSLIYYIIPLVIIAFFYVLMAVRLHTSANEMPGEIRSMQGIAQARARRHVARMVLIFVFLFFICFLPQHIWLLWFNLSPNAEDEFNEWWHATKIVGFCLSFLNSCVNPIALYCVSGVFRAHFNTYLLCRDPRWPRNTFSSTNCDDNFASKIRRNTQTETIENSTAYRKGTSFKKYLEENKNSAPPAPRINYTGHKATDDVRGTLDMGQ